MFYGGSIFCIEGKNTVYGYVLDNNFNTLGLPINFTIPPFNQKIFNKGFYKNYGIFDRNNTFIGITPSESNGTKWQMISAEITKFLPDGKVIFYIFEY